MVNECFEWYGENETGLRSESASASNAICASDSRSASLKSAKTTDQLGLQLDIRHVNGKTMLEASWTPAPFPAGREW